MARTVWICEFCEKEMITKGRALQHEQECAAKRCAPCPFCGSNDELWSYPCGPEQSVGCNACGSRGPGAPTHLAAVKL